MVTRPKPENVEDRLCPFHSVLFLHRLLRRAGWQRQKTVHLVFVLLLCFLHHRLTFKNFINLIYLTTDSIFGAFLIAELLFVPPSRPTWRWPSWWPLHPGALKFYKEKGLITEDPCANVVPAK